MSTENIDTTERTLATINFEYSQLAGQLGDKDYRLMIIEKEVNNIMKDMISIRDAMLKLNEEAKSLPKEQ